MAAQTLDLVPPRVSRPLPRRRPDGARPLHGSLLPRRSDRIRGRITGPCAECRNADYKSFLALTGASGADELDERLHAERGRTHERRFEKLPDGGFVLLDGEPWLVRGPESLLWSAGGYTERRARPRGLATVITPPTTLAVLDAGWEGSVPLLHPSSGTAT